MDLKSDINFQEFKEHFEKIGYYVEDELIYSAFNGYLNFKNNVKNLGQDIFAVCLEGPPGAGKTRYAEVYTEIISNLFNNNVEMLSYQCDPTTGKSELFEEINITAVVSSDIDKINIPGKIIAAINKVNSGKKVVLFIDEYDKSREETDAFLLQFLQSGKINSIQHGDLEIKEKFKSNLQVIICKNNNRNISGPLSRRLRVSRLDYMKPETLYKVTQNVFYDQDGTCKVDEGILNLVLLIYNNIYSDRKTYNRLPACSELLTTVEDTNNLLKYAKAPNYIIYKTIINGIFKDLDSISIFESRLDKSPELKKLIDNINAVDNIESSIDVLGLIKSSIFKQTTLELYKKYEQLEELRLKLVNNGDNYDILNNSILKSEFQTTVQDNIVEEKKQNNLLLDSNLDEHSKYAIVIGSINSILNECDVEEDNELINAFDLKVKISKVLEELRDVKTCESNLIKKINAASNPLKKASSFFKRNTEQKPLLNLENILYTTENDTANMTFMFSSNHHLRLAKKFKRDDNDEQKIYFNNYGTPSNEQLNKDNEFVAKYYDDILHMLDTMEKWHNILEMPIDYKETSEIFEFDTFRLVFSYDTNGNVKAKIMAEKENERLFSKNWIGEPSIYSIIVDNNDSLLKKIPIRKKDLNRISTKLLNMSEPVKVLQKTK